MIVSHYIRSIHKYMRRGRKGDRRVHHPNRVRGEVGGASLTAKYLCCICWILEANTTYGGATAVHQREQAAPSFEGVLHAQARLIDLNSLNEHFGDLDYTRLHIYIRI